MLASIGRTTLVTAHRALRMALGISFAVLPAVVPSDTFAVNISLDFSSLPSMQEPQGPNWAYFATNPRLETQAFHVGPNANNEPTLFQDTFGVGLPCCDSNSYELRGVLDASLAEFSLQVRAAVVAEELNSTSPNHQGFGFYVAYGGSLVGVGIGPSAVDVSDSQGNRDLVTGLTNTGYHDYLLCGSIGPLGGWALSRDGVVLGSGRLSIGSGNNLLSLGDQSGGANAVAEVTHYSFFQASAQLDLQKTIPGTEISWLPLGPGVKYDLVRGDLSVLRSTGGDFTAALDAVTPGTDTCMANDTMTPSVLDTSSDPTAGNGWFYLRRCSASTYNSASSTQQGDRDSEIAASANACP